MMSSSPLLPSEHVDDKDVTRDANTEYEDCDDHWDHLHGVVSETLERPHVCDMWYGWYFARYYFIQYPIKSFPNLGLLEGITRYFNLYCFWRYFWFSVRYILFAFTRLLWSEMNGEIMNENEWMKSLFILECFEIIFSFLSVYNFLSALVRFLYLNAIMESTYLVYSSSADVKLQVVQLNHRDGV